MWLTLHYPTLITPLHTRGGPAEADGSKSLVHVAASIFRFFYPLSLALWGIGRGRAPAAVDGPAKEAIRMRSGTTRTACNVSAITKAALAPA